MKRLLVIAASLAMLVPAAAAPPVSAATMTYQGPFVLDANNESMHFNEIWDLTAGDLVLSYHLDMSQITQPSSWPTGWVESPPGSGNWVFDTTPTTNPSKYPDTYTPWVEVGMRGVGGADFNPGPANTYQGNCGGWMTSESDDWLGAWTLVDGQVVLVDDGQGTQDGDDKHSLAATSGVGEWHYDVEDATGDVLFDSSWNTVLPMFGSHDNHGLWYDRDGVDQWQATAWENSGINAGRINTGGVYDIEITYHALDDGLGVMFAKVNGVMQGFYKPSWHGGGLGELDRYPAGISFKGDMAQMQVFAGSFAYDPAGWDYGTVTLSDINVTGTAAVNPAGPLVPDFTATFVGTTGTFDASATQGGMGPYTYKWDWNNDGTVDETTTDPVVTHTFASPINYSVKLTVTPFRCTPKSVTKEYQQTGFLLPTNTTVRMYAGDQSLWPAMYTNFAYTVRKGTINSVSPGVIFYYNTIQAPSATFTLTVTQTNTEDWESMLVQKSGSKYQANLYNGTTFAIVSKGTPDTNGNVTFNVTGATEGATYYIGIKYSPSNLVGDTPTGVTSTYRFSTTIGNAPQVGSEASISVSPK